MRSSRTTVQYFPTCVLDCRAGGWVAKSTPGRARILAIALALSCVWPPRTERAGLPEANTLLGAHSSTDSCPKVAKVLQHTPRHARLQAMREARALVVHCIAPRALGKETLRQW